MLIYTLLSQKNYTLDFWS